jgi:hypothetical protein
MSLSFLFENMEFLSQSNLPRVKFYCRYFIFMPILKAYIYIYFTDRLVLSRWQILEMFQCTDYLGLLSR